MKLAHDIDNNNGRPWLGDGRLIRPQWGNQEKFQQNLGMVSCKYKMHKESNIEENKEDSKGGGWKCEKETKGSKSSGK